METMNSQASTSSSNSHDESLHQIVPIFTEQIVDKSSDAGTRVLPVGGGGDWQLA